MKVSTDKFERQVLGLRKVKISQIILPAYKTDITLKLPSYRNQSIDLLCKSTAGFYIMAALACNESQNFKVFRVEGSGFQCKYKIYDKINAKYINVTTYTQNSILL